LNWGPWEEQTLITSLPRNDILSVSLCMDYGRKTGFIIGARKWVYTNWVRMRPSSFETRRSLNNHRLLHSIHWLTHRHTEHSTPRHQSLSLAVTHTMYEYVLYIRSHNEEWKKAALNYSLLGCDAV
jgi:hypothetical protein